MIRRRRYTRFPPAAGAAGGDTEALQTDVMRFMSIIGLCLMAVFALVQAIPVQEPGKPVPPSQAASLRAEIRTQQHQLQELQAELHALKSARVRSQHILTRVQHHLEVVTGQTKQVRAERDHLQAQLETLERQLEKERRVLADMAQAAQQKDSSLDELSGRLLDTQMQLDKSRSEIAALQQAAKPVTMKHTPPAPAAKPVPAKQGFTLRFSSADALDRLVTTGSVALYGMAGQQAWRLSMDAGRPAVVPATFPRWFHEMSARTVPAHYVYSLDDAADGPAQSVVVWGVQLPAATREAISTLTRGQPGGELVIRGNGQVTLEE